MKGNENKIESLLNPSGTSNVIPKLEKNVAPTFQQQLSLGNNNILTNPAAAAAAATTTSSSSSSSFYHAAAAAAAAATNNTSSLQKQSNQKQEEEENPSPSSSTSTVSLGDKIREGLRILEERQDRRRLQQQQQQQMAHNNQFPFHDQQQQQLLQIPLQQRRVICIPMDESLLSQRAIRWAIDHFIDKEKDQVILLNSRPLLAGDMVPLVMRTEEYQQESRRKAHELLNASAAVLYQAGIPVKALACCGANPVVELERQVQSLQPTVVLMASHGRSDFSRLLLGSYANHLLHHLKGIPVLVIPLAYLEGKNAVNKNLMATTGS